MLRNYDQFSEKGRFRHLQNTRPPPKILTRLENIELRASVRGTCESKASYLIKSVKNKIHLSVKAYMT